MNKEIKTEGEDRVPLMSKSEEAEETRDGVLG
jgi:hypothetical protein